MLDELYDPVDTVVLLKGIYKSLIRNKINLTDTIEYNDIKKALSVKDIAAINYVNTSIKLYNTDLTYKPLCSLLKFKTEEDAVIFEKNILPLSEDIELKETINNYLYTANEKTLHEEVGDEEAVPYKILTYSDKVIVILDEGFLNYVKKESHLIEFLLSYFNELIKITDLKNIASLPLFKLFVAKV